MNCYLEIKGIKIVYLPNRNIIMVVMGKYENESAYLNFIRTNFLPSRFVLIYMLVDRSHPFYNHFPMNYLRNLGISNVMTTHYIVMDIDLHLSGI